MEFEIDEFAAEQWLIEGVTDTRPNHAPAWCAERAGMDQTGVWIPEEGRSLSAKRIAPALASVEKLGA